MAATNHNKLSFALLAAVLAAPCWALLNDSREPISVEADYAERDERADTMVYRGSVIIRQGSLLIEADQVELFSREGELVQVVSNGQLARYTQQMEDAAEPITAEAEQIDYQPSDKRITLLRNATLSRDGTLLKGERIDYDFISQSWQASGGEQNGSGQPQRRIQLVIPANEGAATIKDTP